MTIDEIQEVVRLCKFHDYKFAVAIDSRGAMYLQGRYWEADVKTGVSEVQSTRRWFLSPMMTRSEIVQTVFKCSLTSMEHRTREWFKYRDEAVFGPHFDVEKLWKLCNTGEHLDARHD